MDEDETDLHAEHASLTRSRLSRSRRLISYGYVGSAALALGGLLLILVVHQTVLGIICFALGVLNIWTTRSSLRRVDSLLARLSQGA